MPKFPKLKSVNIFRRLKLYRFKMPTIILAAIIFFLASNFLLSTVSFRADFSEGKAYTLSNSTKELAKNIKNDITISFFVSADLPPRLQPLKREVEDLLNEYNQLPKVNVQILDPKQDQNALQKAQQGGLQELQFSQLESDQYALTTSFFGILVEQKDQVEAIPQVADTGNLEYNISSAIYKLTSETLPTVAILGQEQAFIPQQQQLAALDQVLQQQFATEYITPPSLETQEGLDVSLEEETTNLEIPEGTKTLLVFDNGIKQYTDEELATIATYIKNNGNAIFFVNGVWVQESLITEEANHNLFNLLNAYGIGINKDLLLSLNAELVNFGDGNVQFFSAYPYWLKTNGFNPETSYFSNVTQLTYPWASSLTLKQVQGRNVRKLVETTSQSWNVTENFILDPQQIPQPQQSDFQRFTVSAESTSDKAGKVTVISSPRFVLDQYLPRTSNNLDFILNIINSYASDGALAGIRQRAVSIYPLPELPQNLQEAYKYFNILLLPGLFGLYGVFKLWRRNRYQY